ncbi:MAG: endonuclease/exonuclease/phosphatase family protein [Lentisphaeria bacterium]
MLQRSHHLARWSSSLALGVPLLLWCWLPCLQGEGRLAWEWLLGSQPQRLFILLPGLLYLLLASRHLRSPAWFLLLAGSVLLVATEMAATVPWRPVPLWRPTAEPAATWRIVTLNVHEAGPDACLPAILRLEPDAVVLQEVAGFRLPAWRAAAAQRGWTLAAEPLLSGSGWIQTVILSRRSLTPLPPVQSINPLTGRIRRFPRVCLAKPAAQPIILIGVHLKSVPRNDGFEAFRASWDARWLQAVQLAAAVRPAPLPVLVAGDCNATPTDRALNPLKEVLRDAWPQVGFGLGATFSSERPALRIDYLWHGPGLQPLRAGRLAPIPDSDHLGVWGDFGVFVVNPKF